MAEANVNETSESVDEALDHDFSIDAMIPSENGDDHNKKERR